MTMDLSNVEIEIPPPRTLRAVWSTESEAEFIEANTAGFPGLFTDPGAWPETLSPFGERLRAALRGQSLTTLDLAERLFPNSSIRENPRAWARMTGGHVRRFLSRMRATREEPRTP